MAAIVPGTNATIQGTSAERQLFTAFMMLHVLEESENYNPDKFEYVSATFNDNTHTFTGTFRLPCEQTISTDGKIQFTAVNYIERLGFSPGYPVGTFKSLNLPSYFVEVMSYCQELEEDPSTNPAKMEQINATYNTETKVLSGTISLVYSPDIDFNTGIYRIFVIDYLLDKQ